MLYIRAQKDKTVQKGSGILMSSWKLEPFQVFMRLLAIVKPEVVVGKCSHLEAIQRARWFACPVMQLCKWKWTVNHSLPSLGLEPSDHPLFFTGAYFAGLQLQFVLHRDQENAQRRSLKGTKRRCQATTRVTNGFVLLQCCQGAHITIILRIPRPQFIAITHLPSVPIERRGIYSKHTHTIFVVHWQQSPKFLAGRRNQSIVETPWPETSTRNLWELFGCSVRFKAFFQRYNWTLRINWWRRISCFSEWYEGCFSILTKHLMTLYNIMKVRIAGHPNV